MFFPSFGLIIVSFSSNQNDHGIDTDVALNQNLMEFQKYLKTEVTPRLDQLQKSAAKKVAM